MEQPATSPVARTGPGRKGSRSEHRSGEVTIQRLRSRNFAEAEGAGEEIGTGDTLAVSLLSEASATDILALEIDGDVGSELGARARLRAIAKRAFDILFAGCALLLLAPLMVAIALSVWLTSPGPVIYAHRRIGLRGRSFHCLKFRTMWQDAEDRLVILLAADCVLRDEFERSFKLRQDPRVTAIGRILRRISFDELPQFWNVLLGQMSVVGPRPIVRAEAVRYGKHLHTVLQVRPGLTGRWQVSGRNNLSYEERVSLDVAYATGYTIRDDLRIVLRTAALIFPYSRSGAY